MTPYRIEHYMTADKQEDLYMRWFSRVRDRTMQVAVIRRVNRMEHGNFGDHRFCRDGVWELRVDIDRAVTYWQHWQEREDHEKQIT